MKIQEVLSWRRKQLKLTLEDVAHHVDVGKSTVRKWEHGIIKNMGRDKIALLAEILQLPPALLLKDDIAADEIGIGTLLPIAKKHIPLVGTTPAGTLREPSSTTDAYITCDMHLRADFALRMEGDSMAEARIKDGDIVFISKQDTVDDGEIAAVLIADTTTLKRIYHIGEKIQCMAENPKYKPIYFDTADTHTFKILGKAIAFYSEIE